MRKSWIAVTLTALLMASLSVAMAREPDEGVKVGNPSFLRKLVSAERIEKAASLQFGQLKTQAESKRALLPPDHPQNVRLRQIARDLLPHADKWNPRAKDWRWEVVTLASRNINAFCMPGGKIVFFTGILEQLRLTDDEVAMIMGHEIAHALREHARERASRAVAQGLLVEIIGAATGVGGGSIDFARLALEVTLNLPNSREQEDEADRIGVELAARAGHDPRAAVTLWQKMAKLGGAGSIEFLSTHPAAEARVKNVAAYAQQVLPLYEKRR